MRIVEMNWFERHPSVGIEQLGTPDACYEMTETPDGSLEQGDACPEPSETEIESSSWSSDRELNGMINHSRLVRLA